MTNRVILVILAFAIQLDCIFGATVSQVKHGYVFIEGDGSNTQFIVRKSTAGSETNLLQIQNNAGDTDYVTVASSGATTFSQGVTFSSSQVSAFKPRTYYCEKES